MKPQKTFEDENQKSSPREVFVRLLAQSSPVIEYAVENDGRCPKRPVSGIPIMGHLAIVVIFIGVVLAYLIYSIIQFMDRPWVTKFESRPTSLYHPMTVQIEISCSNPPNCGQIVLYSDFTNLPVPPECSSQPIFERLPASGGNQTFERKLCFIPEDASVVQLLANNSKGLYVDFSGINPGENQSTGEDDISQRAYGTVTVTAKGMLKMVNMDTWQVKSLYVGTSVKENIAVTPNEKTVELYSMNLQYDGQRVGMWHASYMIRLAQFANVFITERPGSIMDVLARVGGAASLVAGLMAAAGPVLQLLFRHICKNQTEEQDTSPRKKQVVLTMANVQELVKKEVNQQMTTLQSTSSWRSPKTPPSTIDTVWWNNP